MKSTKRIIHRIAFCETCGIISEKYLSARREGKDHAEKTGHAVSVETGSIVFYNKESLTKQN